MKRELVDLLPNSMEERLRVPLSKNRLFEGLTPLELFDILEIATVVSYAPGENLFREGDEGDGLYLIERGIVQVSKEIPNIGEKVIAVLKENSIFGEMSLLDDRPRSATVTPLVPSSFIKIDRDGFLALKQNFRFSAYKVIFELCKIMSERIRETNEKVVEYLVNPEKHIEDFKRWKGYVRKKNQSL